MRCLYFFFFMIRPPQRSTLTYTRFPYTTLFRSVVHPFIVLGAAEIRQHLAEAPARRAMQGRPVVVVGGMAACIDHRVHRRRAAEHAAARLEAAQPAQARPWLGLEAPVAPFHRHEDGGATWHPAQHLVGGGQTGSASSRTMGGMYVLISGVQAP